MVAYSIAGISEYNPGFDDDEDDRTDDDDDKIQSEKQDWRSKMKMMTRRTGIDNF